ncbi:MAG TPA: hypothetical protein VFK70_01425 [Vicinamibacteria bacterium]|nr:hypothetical protein [Vicinamibacteria bacterium]
MAEEGLSGYGLGKFEAFAGGRKPAGCIELHGCDPAVLYAILARCDPGHAWKGAIEIARTILRDAMWLYRVTDPFVRQLADLSPHLYEGAGREWSETFDFNHHARSAPECARMVEGLAGLARVALGRRQGLFILTSIDEG